MELALAQSNTKLYLPEPARIVKVKSFTEHEKFFQIELLRKGSLGHDPGQFVEVSILGIGEAPISIASPPDSGNRFDLCARAVGDVTKKLVVEGLKLTAPAAEKIKAVGGEIK